MPSQMLTSGVERELGRKVEELRRELDEAHRREAATAEVLRVISRFASDAKPAFDIIAGSALRLVNAQFVGVVLYDGEVLHLAALHNSNPQAAEAIRRAHPRRPDDSSSVGRAIQFRGPVQIPDVLEDPTYELKNVGWRSVLSVPMLRNNEPIGVIAVGRDQPGPFSERQIALLQTFADQAVIAIENARLFTELQEKNGALTQAHAQVTETLEQQTATSEILRVISSSPTDIQPVFDAIIANAMRLCEGDQCVLLGREGETITFLASHHYRPEGQTAVRAVLPRPLRRDTTAGRAILERKTVQISDVLDDSEYGPKHLATVAQYRATIAVPMMREGEAIGAVTVTREAPGEFSPRQIELLHTFADQAVIAIENARLFEEVQGRTKELQESLEYQTAIAEVLGVISRSPTELRPVLEAIVNSARDLCHADYALCRALEERQSRAEGETFLRVVDRVGNLPDPAQFRLSSRLSRGHVTGRAMLDRRTIHVPDLDAELDEFPDAVAYQKAVGIRTALATPLLRDGKPLGAITLLRKEVNPFNDKQTKLLETLADQAVIAIENTRLFEEVQARTRELAKTVDDLEIASQHKSQFVANMSHELRTPLAAILGYTELIQEGFYEPQGPKSLDALTRIRSNGKHLLGLINTVLDIAKIESGQFTLNMAEYAIESVVETVRSATESLAQNKKLLLKTDVAKSMPIGLGDEQRLTQVLLNLVGNAIKFTDAGEVCVTAIAVNGHFVVAVTDTGPGIPEQEQSRIFDQFHQVDSSLTKAKGGTGLGLAIAKQIVEMHGGRIWVESTVGQGSTFRMELPLRATTANDAA